MSYSGELQAQCKHLNDRIKALAAENDWLRSGIKVYLDGNYAARLPSKLDKCEHGRFGYEACEGCIDKHFEHVLAQTKAPSHT